jgi:peptidoglycan/LPS O-acetylase OafA/YrhL
MRATDISLAPMSGVKTSAPRIDSLTGARFLAAAAVFVHHSVGPDHIPFVDLGYLGVTFFFVLSGFVLTWAGSADRGIITSYRNRFARIYPLHIVTLVIAVVLPGWFVLGSPQLFVQSVFLLQSWTSAGSASFNWVAWSISNEAFFYLLFPFVLKLLRRFTPRTLVLVAVIVWIGQAGGGLLLNVRFPDPGMTAYVAYIFPPFRFAEFVIGMCLALFLRSGARLPRWGVRAAIAIAVAGLVGVVATDLGPSVTRNVVIAMALPATVVIIGGLVLRELEGGARALRSPTLVKLGEWSFAFYMVHALVIRVVAWALGLPTPGYMPLWSIVPTFLVSLLAAWAAHRFVEAPMERLLRAKRPQVGGSTRPSSDQPSARARSLGQGVLSADR